MSEDPQSDRVVETIVTLAHNLGMNVVAEGVENAAQEARLQQIGCDFGQGYHFAKPLSAADAEALLASTAAIQDNVSSERLPGDAPSPTSDEGQRVG
jgi:EAL domain-containing protein (putative c-di-GMP-specific phosphodiesterase class I)